MGDEVFFSIKKLCQKKSNKIKILIEISIQIINKKETLRWNIFK